MGGSSLSSPFDGSFTFDFSFKLCSPKIVYLKKSILPARPSVSLTYDGILGVHCCRTSRLCPNAVARARANRSADIEAAEPEGDRRGRITTRTTGSQRQTTGYLVCYSGVIYYYYFYFFFFRSLFL